MIEREEFDHLVRDALANLNDTAELEVHPLASLFPRPPGNRNSRARHLRQLFLDAIETLRPPDQEASIEGVEWRPYLVMQGRYVEGVGLQGLQARLSLSPRQLRREHGRALQALTTLLWDRMQAAAARTDAGEEGGDADAWGSSPRTFEIAREPLELAKVLRGVCNILARRVSGEGAALVLDLGTDLPRVQADRVILRQILLSLIHYALQARKSSDISLHAETLREHVALTIHFQAVEGMSLELEREEALETALYWVQRLDGALDLAGATNGADRACVRLLLPRARESLVLVVDDQEAAIRMFQRYLSQANVRVVGVREPEQVLALARELAPAAITLDVMMPTLDGWEILQSLKVDPETSDIPVIVCSVWDEPELAASLGAARFLKKPITQGDLWAVLAELGVLDRLDGSSPGDT
jgi:CheY-like chemotaxis protein